MNNPGIRFLQCSETSLDAFPDKSPFISKHPSGDLKGFEGSRGKCLQDESCLGRLPAVIQFEFLDVWHDGRGWGGGGFDFS